MTDNEFYKAISDITASGRTFEAIQWLMKSLEKAEASFRHYQTEKKEILGIINNTDQTDAGKLNTIKAIMED